MGDGSGNEGKAPGRTRAFWLILWHNRTKISGYLGVIVGAFQVGLLGGQHWPMCALGALVAAIGHYNDQHQSAP
jgi:hypothetical protein